MLLNWIVPAFMKYFVLIEYYLFKKDLFKAFSLKVSQFQHVSGQ